MERGTGKRKGKNVRSEHVLFNKNKKQKTQNNKNKNKSKKHFLTTILLPPAYIT